MTLIEHCREFRDFSLACPELLPGDERWVLPLSAPVVVLLVIVEWFRENVL